MHHVMPLSHNLLVAGGIFSMHEVGGLIATGSKDGTICLTHLGPDAGFLETGRLEDTHTGVVKCVRWRDATHLASCGNDRRDAELEALPWPLHHLIFI